MERELIAIIGMAGRFPKADCVEAFWENLINGRDCITREDPLVTKENGYSVIHAYGKMDGIYEFDQEFFGISSNDAVLMEPQERIFLECAYHALEDAGYVEEKSKYQVGIVCGAQENEYYLKERYELKRGNRLTRETEKFLNSGVSLAGRISYKLNLTGPSIIVNTACSTSLTAVAMAADMIRNGDADLMLAGGTNVSIAQEDYVHIEGMSANDGVVRPFDANSSGMVPGSGVGAVVLKAYTKAVADGDQVYAVIKGSAIGNDGNRKMGYTAPSIQGEYEVIHRTMERSGVREDEMDYIETHGTATTLGDCIEVRALNKAYQQASEDKQIPIGSLKGNFGHMNSAAGIAGLIKGALILKNQVLPASIHMEKENEELKVSKHVYVNCDTHVRKDVRNVGISSFGIGGMNTHMILGRANRTEEQHIVPREELIGYSARSEYSLLKNGEALKRFLVGCRSNAPVNYGQIAYTSLLRRTAYERRGVFLVDQQGNHEVLYAPTEKIMLQIGLCNEELGDADTLAMENAKELSEKIPEFSSLYEQAKVQENGKGSVVKSFQTAVSRLLKELGFHIELWKAGKFIEQDEEEFSVYIGDAWRVRQGEESCIKVIRAEKEGMCYQALLHFLGYAWLKNHQVNWERIFYKEQQKVVSLPEYQFQKNVHQLEFEKAVSEENLVPDTGFHPDVICELFQKEAEDDTLTLNSSLEEAGLDSMMILVIKSKIAQHFQVDITIQEFYNCDTIQDVIELVKERRKPFMDEEIPKPLVESQPYLDIEDLFDNL